MDELYCCYVDEDDIECENEPTWEIWFGSEEGDFTHTCDAHLPLMLDPYVENKVHFMPQEKY